MKGRHRFRPAFLQDLEPRVVLSGGAQISPAPVGKLTINARSTITHQVVDQINVAFDSFTTDYLQAQGAYLHDSTAPHATTAFANYVNQRVELLAAQLTRIFAHVPGSLNRLQTSTPGGPVVLQSFLRTRINGLGRTSLLVSLNGRRGVGSSALPPAGTTGTTATLYTDQAISAIETARTASINSAAFLFSHSFQKH
jgi:hypothetical protein